MKRILLFALPFWLCMLTPGFATGPSAQAAPATPERHGKAASTRILPPAIPWDGASRQLVVTEGEWQTPSEASGLTTSPNYDDTMAWLRRLVDAAPQLRMVSLGKSGQGRDVWMVIASADGAFDAARLRASDKPVVLAQAGIHSGEIDGKDAGMMLLRDLTVRGTHRHLLDHVQLLFVPIFNVDGHERSSRFGRINQRGPESMGWRTTARNLNLNRDYAKADSAEMRVLLTALSEYQPDLYVDLHVTDGIDYQYDITWGYSGQQAYSPAISKWLENTLDPPVLTEMRRQGHIPGYLVFSFDPSQPDQGLFKWSASTPRYSDGYGAARHLPTILVENHSLKPYDQRVLGTYVFLTSLLDTVGKNAASLQQAIATDRARRPEKVAVTWQVPQDRAPEQIEFLGVEWRHEDSAISGRQEVRWLGKPVTKTLIQVEPTQPGIEVSRPEAYWVPATWPEVIARLAAHGIEMEVLAAPRSVAVEMYRMHTAQLTDAPFEGHVRVDVPEAPSVEQRTEVYPAGSVRISTDQPLGELAVLLLEPQAPDSFFQWGFFLEVLDRKEYVEAYVMEPMAQRMLDEDPALAKEFAAKLKSDEEFAADPRARLQWFYQRTPYFDQRWQLYPVGREVAAGTKPSSSK